ncbi:DNA repair protein RadA [Heliophilum fasciatum]|uniref:DNA repair protein RadA n=1 Tax=Heliophilum fasciatum TaxID=35700 RepID=A0A4R2RL66_9FIRM|nr:DNA repair protein RadA [Heliophilum fasciatum]MCW2277848.1 DNA repair protein RadA/Sms [Heliophilum fasciatum]TCP64660.1 DNA repair protein RadA/Sms [Heliophilum fasciatum]
MAKEKTRFFCKECGQESLKWMGRCPGCDAWNSLVEEKVAKASPAPRYGIQGQGAPGRSAPVHIDAAEAGESLRFSTGIQELDRVLGGGIVEGSLTLLAGDPGIGKSTLLLQVAEKIAAQGRTVLYISGEESIQQVKMRAHRLGVRDVPLYLLAETDIEAMSEAIVKTGPKWVVVDSIQTAYWATLGSAPGNVAQVRECAAHLLRIAKDLSIAITLVGHVTKEGSIAGPRVLEHMVDAVLYLEGERNYPYRVLRGVKNRFGSTNELGIFEMRGEGMAEVANPSAFFLAERTQGVAGSVVVPCLEGTRTVLVEIQALVTPTAFGQARRMATGLDYNRTVLLAAVLDKRVGLHLGQQDIYVNVAGGLKIMEPAADLGVVVAIASGWRNRSADPECVVFGEVGLTGEVRAVAHLEKRVKEAAKLGFKRCICPQQNRKYWKDAIDTVDMEVIGVNTVDEALVAALGS